LGRMRHALLQKELALQLAAGHSDLNSAKGMVLNTLGTLHGLV
jgi:hypothetical protein